MHATYDVLIVGAGHSGAHTAIALRQQGFVGSVALVGEETEQPYERPPLSKEFLCGDKEFDRLLIRPATFWQERDVQVLTGRHVTTVDADAHTVRTASGEVFAFGHLVWATGGRARQLSCPGARSIGVHYLRTRADAEAIDRAQVDADRVVIIGGGYIGLEVAAALTNKGKRVTLLETCDRVLARVAGEALSRFYEAEHRGRGVDLRLDARVDAIQARDGHVTGVRLADGSMVAADLVVAGIGLDPSVEALTAAGAEGANGVIVDEFARTSLPGVLAVGDCALHPNPYAGGLIRLESVQNAVDMAATAAHTIIGDPRAYDEVPWFWSNQYDLKLKTVGLSAGHDHAVIRGDVTTGKFSVVYLRDGRVIALDCVNSARDFAQGRALVTAGARVKPELLADVSVPLKQIDSAVAT